MDTLAQALETYHRYQKAKKLASFLQRAGCDYETSKVLPEASKKLALEGTRIDKAGAITWSLVSIILCERERATKRKEERATTKRKRGSRTS
jgi:hypothetical protein